MNLYGNIFIVKILNVISISGHYPFWWHIIPLRRRARRNCERTYLGSSLDVDDTLQRPLWKKVIIINLIQNYQLYKELGMYLSGKYIRLIRISTFVLHASLWRKDASYTIQTTFQAHYYFSCTSRCRRLWPPKYFFLNIFLSYYFAVIITMIQIPWVQHWSISRSRKKPIFFCNSLCWNCNQFFINRYISCTKNWNHIKSMNN